MPIQKFGKVYKRKDSPFWWIWYYDATGKRRHESTQTKDKDLAWKILRSRISEFEGLRSGVKAISDMPYSAFGDMFLKHYKARYGFETVKSHRSVVNVFQKFIDGEGLSQFSEVADRGVVNRFITYRREVRRSKTNTCNNSLKCLHKQFEFAIEQKLLRENPLRKYKKIPVTDAEEKKALNKDEYQRFMKIVRKGYPFYYPIYYTFFHTGLRFTELISQRWDDTFLEEGYLRVTRPKGKKSPDKPPVAFHDGVVGVLKQLPRTSEYVFLDEHGKPFVARTRKFIRRLKKILAKAEITTIKDIHGLRHTYCSQLFDAGFSPTEVQAQMRHTELRTTQRYGHIFRPQLNRKVSRLQRLDR
jgi:integrase